MCTLSWSLAEDGFTLFMSRDELRARAPARAPELTVQSGVRFLAPRDPDGGGTWLAANEHGVALALLNGYGEYERAGPFESRGRLVLSLCDAKTPSEVVSRISSNELSRFRDFELAVFAPGARASALRWDGRALSLGFDEAAPLASSSRVQREARDSRRLRFRALVGASGDAELRRRFHREHWPERGALSACMHRSDAETVSYAELSVSSREVRLAYAAGAPCTTPLEEPLVLARV